MYRYFKYSLAKKGKNKLFNMNLNDQILKNASSPYFRHNLQTFLVIMSLQD
jgi:hypothetical protein